MHSFLPNRTWRFSRRNAVAGETVKLQPFVRADLRLFWGASGAAHWWRPVPR